MKIRNSSGNVFSDAGFSSEQAENLRVRSTLMMSLIDFVRANELTQEKAATVFGVSQPRVSNLMRGKIGLFTIDTLVNMAASAGLKVEVGVSSLNPKRRRRVA